MNTNIRRNLTPLLGLLIPFSLGFSLQAVAQGAEEGTDAGPLEEVVIIGTRRQARSVEQSPAPIDVISGDEFLKQGATDLSTLIRNVVPSYNVNQQPISDAGTVSRPANLRGLQPDHTLVLINGKRRHRGAVINWLGNGVADGAQGADISNIPAIALKQVEILRDGAAAQYGSDAIAGVLNFVLKDAADGSTIEFRTGEYFEGDGQTYTVSANIGLPLSDSGFANFSFEYGESDPTSRSIQRDDAAALIAAGYSAVRNPAQIWGSPEIEGDLKAIANIGLDLGDNREAYLFGNYAQKTVTGGFYFRNPNTREAVFALDGFRLIGDVLDAQDGVLDGSGNCPVLAVPDLNNAAEVAADMAALAALASNPNCFSFNAERPGGFTPNFGGDVVDASLVAGVRGEFDNGMLWDVSVGYGYSDVNFFIVNTVNASLGPQSPFAFNPGAYTQIDTNFNLDISYPVEVASFHSPLNVAVGFEYRDEQFEITVGDQASWEIGPYADQGFSAASNGFPGFGPIAGGVWSRSNIALYVDLEADITEDFLGGLAVRFEDFDDFGTTTNFKLSGRYQVADNFALRSTYSTGFRAPTPGQSNAFNVSTEFDLVKMELVNNGTVPPTNPVAMARGGKELDAEDSTNYTLGAIFSVGAVNVTIDYFNIELEDRITLSAEQALSQAEIDALVESGVTSAGNLANFRFFTNDFDTTTSGFDIVATTSVELGGGNTDFSLAFNRTETEVDSFTPGGTIDATRILELENALPETRMNFTVNHSQGDWDFLGRYSYYDDFYDSEDTAFYGAESIFDAEVSYHVNDTYTVTLGAQNLFDETPDENVNAAAGVGNAFSQWAPSGFNGGFWYVRLRAEFN